MVRMRSPVQTRFAAPQPFAKQKGFIFYHNGRGQGFVQDGGGDGARDAGK